MKVDIKQEWDREALGAGTQARYEGKEPEETPYPVGSWQEKSYLEGWSQADRAIAGTGAFEQ